MNVSFITLNSTGMIQRYGCCTINVDTEKLYSTQDFSEHLFNMAWPNKNFSDTQKRDVLSEAFVVSEFLTILYSDSFPKKPDGKFRKSAKSPSTPLYYGAHWVAAMDSCCYSLYKMSSGHAC